jgi:hypothetical protein
MVFELFELRGNYNARHSRVSDAIDRHLSSLLRCEIEQRFKSGYPRLSRALTNNQLESNTMTRDGSSKFVESIPARTLKVSDSLTKVLLTNFPEDGCKIVGNARFNRTTRPLRERTFT